jgi:hypothetical protein
LESRAARGLWFTSARHAELLNEQVNGPTGTEVTVRFVGEVIEAGPEAKLKLGQRVFARNQHQDYFNVKSEGWLISQVPDRSS